MPTAIQNLETHRIKDVDVDSTFVAIKTASSTFFGVDVDNSANTVAVFFEVYNDASPSVGTDEPDFRFKILAGAKRKCVPNEGHGVVMGTAISVACVLTAGGSDDPANAVPATVMTS